MRPGHLGGNGPGQFTGTLASNSVVPNGTRAYCSLLSTDSLTTKVQSSCNSPCKGDSPCVDECLSEAQTLCTDSSQTSVAGLFPCRRRTFRYHAAFGQHWLTSWNRAAMQLTSWSKPSFVPGPQSSLVLAQADAKVTVDTYTGTTQSESNALVGVLEHFGARDPRTSFVQRRQATRPPTLAQRPPRTSVPVSVGECRLRFALS